MRFLQTSSGSPAWGYCSKKRRLPSSGFDHSESALRSLLQIDVPTLLERHEGCASRPLVVLGNTAVGLGGGMFIGDCYESSQRSGICSIFSSKKNGLSAMQVKDVKRGKGSEKSKRGRKKRTEREKMHTLMMETKSSWHAGDLPRQFRGACWWRGLYCLSQDISLLQFFV